MRSPGRTPPFRGPNGAALPDSIAQVEYLPLGGLDQWVMMRGENLANPPLVVLHGGPGFPEARFFRRFNAPLEKSFTVVHWDQRGSGKSFAPDIPRASMTTDRFLADLDELIQVVVGRTGHRKVAIFGHSWGSALGVLYAARLPEKVSTYVGSGQLGDWQASEAASYAFVLAEAQRRRDWKALQELRSIGPPPYGANAVWTERMWLNRFEGQLRPSVLWGLARALLAGSEFSLFDLPNLWRGFRFSLDAMWAEVSRLNLFALAPSLEVPVFFLLGRHDHWVPAETSVAYFEALRAPAKSLVWFDRSGHEPFVDEPAAFNATMVERVRPAAVGKLDPR